MTAYIIRLLKNASHSSSVCLSNHLQHPAVHLFQSLWGSHPDTSWSYLNSWKQDFLPQQDQIIRAPPVHLKLFYCLASIYGCIHLSSCDIADMAGSFQSIHVRHLPINKTDIKWLLLFLWGFNKGECIDPTIRPFLLYLQFSMKVKVYLIFLWEWSNGWALNWSCLTALSCCFSM